MAPHSQHEFNLLPEDRQDTIKRGKSNHKLLKVAILLLATTGALLLVAKTWEAGLVEQHQLATTELYQLETNLEPFISLRTEVARILDRLTTIDQLEQNRFLWTDHVVALAAATPSTVQIIAVTPTLKDNQLIFSLTGQATTRADIVRFKQALETTKLFTDLLIENSQITESTTASPVSFTLTGSLNPASRQEE
ncbi:MAG: hypothetical protein AAB647_03400 [Patescibacteria group bacterium]